MIIVNVPFKSVLLKRRRYANPKTIPGTVLVIIEKQSKIFFKLLFLFNFK